MVAAHHGRVPSSGDEDGLDTAGNWGGEDVADLHANEERESHDDRGETTTIVVLGSSEAEVEVGKEGAGVADEETAKGENGTDQAILGTCQYECKQIQDKTTYVDEGINTTVLNHVPGVLGSRDVRLAVQCNVDKGIAVEELNSPLNNGQNAAHDAEDDPADHTKDTALVACRVSSDRAYSAQELDDGNDQTAEADGTEAVGQGSARRGACGVLGEVVDTEVPGTVDTGDDGVDYVLDKLRNPVHSKGNEDNQSDQSSGAAVAI